VSFSLGFVGTGKVGTTLARLWAERGYDVVAVYNTNESSANQLAQLVGAEVKLSASDVVKVADLTLLTVPDDRLASVVLSLAGINLHSKAIIHTSGALDMTVLDMLAQQGAFIGSLHPAFPFADVEMAILRLPEATFAIEAGESRLRGWLLELIAALSGKVIEIPVGGKALYHAALVILGNYTVTLYALAERLLTDLGADRVSADFALNALLTGVIHNLQTQGIPNALTGPLIRADVGTLARHLVALKSVDEEVVRLYTQLARLTYPMLTARGVDILLIEKTLKQGTQDAIDDS